MERSTWHLLEARGALTCPASHGNDDPTFQQAYDWMKASMNDAGLRAPAESLTPWWCWVRREPDHPQPYIEDLRGHEDPVVLQLSIPSNLVALLCFDLWHFVLNRWYVPASDEDDVDYDRALETAEEGSEAALRLEERLKKSWSAIFKLDQSQVDMGPFESKSIQGCFWTLEHSHVTAVVERAGLDSYEET
ncbi:DUF3841 domain-containing protein [Pseudomonas sp.]